MFGFFRSASTNFIFHLSLFLCFLFFSLFTIFLGVWRKRRRRRRILEHPNNLILPYDLTAIKYSRPIYSSSSPLQPRISSPIVPHRGLRPPFLSVCLPTLPYLSVTLAGLILTPLSMENGRDYDYGVSEVVGLVD